jgi:hypothetical protein
VGKSKPAKRRARIGRRALERAEWQRRKAVERELEASGVMAKVRAVREQLANPLFGRCLNTALARAERVRRLTSENEVREVVLSVLRDDFRADVSAVLLKVHWNPATKQLGVKAFPGVTEAMAAAERATAKTAPRFKRAAALAGPAA